MEVQINLILGRELEVFTSEIREGDGFHDLTDDGRVPRDVGERRGAPVEGRVAGQEEAQHTPRRVLVRNYDDSDTRSLQLADLGPNFVDALSLQLSRDGVAAHEQDGDARGAGARAPAQRVELRAQVAVRLARVERAALDPQLVEAADEVRPSRPAVEVEDRARRRGVRLHRHVHVARADREALRDPRHQRAHAAQRVLVEV